MIKDAISIIIEGKDLSKQQAYDVMKDIMGGQATPSQIAGFLVALRDKGETIDEIAGCALAMRDAAVPLSIKTDRIVDSCGTGGDGKGGLNVSTAAAFVAAGAGLTVAKHGNRSVSSKCGSADVLEMLGVKLDAPAAVIEMSLNDTGIGFLFAPNFHPAMKHAMPTRKELGIRTVFNILGPLTNPARASVQLIGVYKKEMTKLIAGVMAKMGHKAGLVVHSDGWDEITLDKTTHVSEMMGGKVKNYTLTHKDFGLPKVSSSVLKGSDAAGNAVIIEELLSGKRKAIEPIVIANAAALVWISERAFGKKNYSLKDAVKRAQEAILSGAAADKLKKMAETSHHLE